MPSGRISYGRWKGVELLTTEVATSIPDSVDNAEAHAKDRNAMCSGGRRCPGTISPWIL